MTPVTDDRDGADVIRSRVGLEGRGIVISNDLDLYDWFLQNRYDVLVIRCV